MTYSFAADRTLGKLAKWLRILGFDTIFEPEYAGRAFYDRLVQERVLLTRIVKMRDRFDANRLIFIQSDRGLQARDGICGTSATRVAGRSEQTAHADQSNERDAHHLKVIETCICVFMASRRFMTVT